MVAKQVLLITEGADDKKMLRLFYEKFGIPVPTIVLFKSNIHQICALYEKNEQSYEDLNICGLLREKLDSQKNKHDYELLSRKFAEIFLIFDFDPQAPEYKKDYLGKFLEHFSDSTQYGKLLINYPMLESFCHLDKKKIENLEEDTDYFDKTFSGKDLSQYKNRVSKEGMRFVKATSRIVTAFMIQHHMKKAQTIVASSENGKNLGEKIFSSQGHDFEKKGKAQILNTSCLIIPTLYPKLYKESFEH